MEDSLSFQGKRDNLATLTEFAPLSPEAKSSVSHFLSRIFGKNRGQAETSPADITPSVSDDESTKSSSTEYQSAASPSRKPEDLIGARSVANVVRRISGILERNSSNLQVYKDSDFKQYWMPDSNCKECYECGDKFTTFRRRHHCRVCGQIFCRRCCNQGIPGKLMGYSGDLRVCTYCCKVVLSYIQSLDTATDDARALQEDLEQKLCTLTGPRAVSPLQENLCRRKSSTIGFREEDIAQAMSFGRSHDLSSIDLSALTPFERRIIQQDEVSLRELWSQMNEPITGIGFQSHRYRLRNYANCIVGSELVDWLVDMGRSSSRLQASLLGQALIDARLLVCVNHEQIFIDGYVLYQPGEKSFAQSSVGPLSSSNQESQDPLWVKEIQTEIKKSSSEPGNSLEIVDMPLDGERKLSSGMTSSTSTFYLDIDLKESRVLLSRPRSSSRQQNERNEEDDYEPARKELVCQEEFLTSAFMNENNDGQSCNDLLVTYNSQLIQENSTERKAYEQMNEAYDSLEQNLLLQLLSAEGLSLSWCDTILPIVHGVADTVRPDVRNDNDDMDIRQYVQIKKIPGGSKSECSIVRGVVCTKHVAHKKMKQNLLNPTILLLSSAMVYQRVESKFSSLDPIIMQENEYLKNIVGKISVSKPDLLLVEKTVSRIAQEMLLDLGVTLVLNVKPSVMERVARCTQAGIVLSIDAHLGRPQLGVCHQFHVQNFHLTGNRTKNLMFFDGCASNLGCTVLLRGGTNSELKKVKHILHFMIYVAYSWRLERSYLTDECALPPPHPEDLSLMLDSVATEPESLKQPSSKGGTPCLSTTEEDGPEKRLEVHFVDDCSDPLRCYLQTEDEAVFVDSEASLQVEPMPFANQFRKALDDVVLCCSPNVKVSLPYLETEAGKACPLRPFFPEEIYWSSQFSSTGENPKKTGDADDASLHSSISQQTSEPADVLPCHPLTYHKITDSFQESIKLQSLLSDFRARGGRIRPMNLRDAFNPSNTAKKSSPQPWEGRVDALSPFNHQRLAVLFCSYSGTSNNAPNFCVSPWVVNMDFYGRNDIPLGGFLERYCFRSSYMCPSLTCETPMTEHIRKFAHENGCVHINLHEIDNYIAAAQSQILMWSWCQKCKETTPVVSMSQDTWSLSFAKYLELRFYGSQYTRRGSDCIHSLHHDHYQYFVYKQLVASFKFTPIIMREVSLPPLVIVTVDVPTPLTAVLEEIKPLAVTGYSVYSTILEILCTLKAEVQGTKHEAAITEMMEQQHNERSLYRERIEAIQLKLTSPTTESKPSNSKETCNAMWKICDSVTMLKKQIAEAVNNWNSKIQEFVVIKKKDEKATLKTTSGSQVPTQTVDPAVTTGQEALASLQSSEETEADSITFLSPSNFQTTTSCNSTQSTSWNDISSSELTSNDPNQQECKQTLEALERLEADVPITRSKELSPSRSSSSLSSYTYGTSPGIYAALPGPPSNDSAYVVCHQMPVDSSEKSYESKGHERSKSDGADKLTDSKQFKPRPLSEDDSKLERRERGSVKNLLSQLLYTSSIAQIQNPFPTSQHILPIAPDKVAVIVHEQEPSSIIAYTLTSTEYEQQLQELKTTLLNSQQSVTSSPTTRRRFQPKQFEKMSSVESELSTMDFSDFALCSSQELERSSGGKSGTRIPNLNVEVQFSDTSTRFYCRVYFAEQFRKLRRLVFPEGEERYIRSLSHCVSWMARGGKSGSIFCKTLDDRFILKEMSRLEVQSFIEFAPYYFQYINKSCADQKPTVLAKIVGVYRIGYKNAATNSASKLDLLVMENLFYRRNISQKFDLKGSVRNRLVSATQQEESDVVLLDENLLKMTCEAPLYIRPHSKTVLTIAITNDTQFLASHSVMDYSLLVGMDDDKKELVVGIIDYIRTFTWDKKLEMVVKSSGILGGHGKLPTVVSPDLYRMRFCEAMDRYFLWVPDRWSCFGKGVDS